MHLNKSYTCNCIFFLFEALAAPLLLKAKETSELSSETCAALQLCLELLSKQEEVRSPRLIQTTKHHFPHSIKCNQNHKHLRESVSYPDVMFVLKVKQRSPYEAKSFHWKLSHLI